MARHQGNQSHKRQASLGQATVTPRTFTSNPANQFIIGWEAPQHSAELINRMLRNITHASPEDRVRQIGCAPPSCCLFPCSVASHGTRELPRKQLPRAQLPGASPKSCSRWARTGMSGGITLPSATMRETGAAWASPSASGSTQTQPPDPWPSGAHLSSQYPGEGRPSLE